MTQFRFPIDFWHIELSTKCSLRCPRCPRTEFAGRYKVDEMSVDLIKNIFVDEVAKEAKHIFLCGGQGDPIYNRDSLKIISFFKDLSDPPAVKIITNGSYRPLWWWKELANILTEKDTITFSVDGWDNQSNNLYRVNSNFDSIIKGIKVMVKSPCTVRWATIFFKFNQDKIETILDLAKSLGVDYFDLTKSSLFGSTFNSYIDKSLGYDPLEPDQEWVSKYGRFEKHTIKLSSNEVSKGGKNYEQLFENRKKQYKHSHIIPLCKCVGLSFLNVEGIYYPCSWVSHPFIGKTSLFSDKKVVWKDNVWNKYKDQLNLNIYSLKEVFENPLWDNFEASWESKNRSLIECENKCLNKTVDYEEVNRTEVDNIEASKK